MEKAEDAAEAWRKENNTDEMGAMPYKAMKLAFLAGAEWSRLKTIEECAKIAESYGHAFIVEAIRKLSSLETVE